MTFLWVPNSIPGLSMTNSVGVSIALVLQMGQELVFFSL